MKLKIVLGGFAFLLIAMFFACQSDDEITFSRYYSTGSVIYQNKCQNCHGKDGEGLSALMPPLTDSVFLKANKATLPCIIKYGTKGKLMIVNQKSFEGDMPSIDLAPIEIAEVLTYVTNSFGNKMGIVSNAQVDGALKNCR
jgi:mono/diheme cytochrome c family protein